MAKKVPALGKGLDALLGGVQEDYSSVSTDSAESESSSGDFAKSTVSGESIKGINVPSGITVDENGKLWVDPAFLKPNPQQPRQEFSTEDLQELAAERKLSKSVAFAGYVPSPDLVYFYKMAQVFVFPSKTETQGLVTVEAMLSGLPVVAIGEMGTVDVMQGDHGGFMVKDDVAEFSDKVVALLKNQQLRKKKAQEALDWGKKWKISALTPRLLECYEKAALICKNKYP